jgi:hypothetical protein
MASKKLQNRVESVERMDAQLKQLALRLDRAKKALGVDERRERVAELCEIGGDFLSVGLGAMAHAERLGAFMILAEMAEDEAFLEKCRRRAAAETARRQQAKDDKKAGKCRKRRESEVSVEFIEPAPVRSAPSVAPAAAPVTETKEPLIVRFTGPISGLGQRLRSLGLNYDPAKREWMGLAERTAVEAEIKASPCAPLLEEISSLTPLVATSAAQPATSSAVGWWPQLRNNDVGEVELES